LFVLPVYLNKNNMGEEKCIHEFKYSHTESRCYATSTDINPLIDVVICINCGKIIRQEKKDIDTY
jgi:Fe2+ or Zn2+ uptake regulation protein